LRSYKKKEDLIVLSIKTLAMATAVSAGVVFAMPVSSQAMPMSSPVKIQAVNDGNIVTVNHKKHWKKWAWYCRHHDDWRCYRHHRRYARYRLYYDEPYYGYYEPYYYRPYYYRPGTGLYFGIH
jgi:hypothetical protein